MSEALATIDLSTILVNGTGRIDLSQLKTAYNNPSNQELGHIRIFNDSGSTLKIRSDSGIVQDYIPAGAWVTYAIDHSTQAIDFTVISILPNAPIQLLMSTYFSPGEPIPDTPQLGNSPVGIGNSLPISAQASSVADDGRVSGSETVEASVGGIKHISFLNQGLCRLLLDATSSNQETIELVNIATGGDTWGIFILTSNGLSFFDATSGKTALVLFRDGTVQLSNQNFTSDANGNITAVGLTASGLIKIVKNMSSADQDMIELAPADDTANIDQVIRSTFATSDMVFFDKKNNGEMFRIKNTAGANSGILVSGIGGRVRAWSMFTFAGAGGFTNHGLGAIPNVILGMQNIAGTETLGWIQATATATQVNITTGAANGGVAMALLMA